jgi:hypothetical protein
MTNEDIARLIVEAYNMGKADGHDEGYRLGYDEGYEEAYDRAFKAGVEDGISQVAEAKEQEIDDQLGELEESDYACRCPQCVNPVEYDAGYAAGFGATELCPDYESYAYRAGYMDAQYDSKKGTDKPV